MATSTRQLSGIQAQRTHLGSSVLWRTVAATVVWLVVLTGLLILAPRGAAAPADAEGVSTPALSAAVPSAPAPWGWPLPPVPVVDRAFERPATRFAAGHRGIDLVGALGAPVMAVAEGVVTHSGVVAGRGTVTVLHSSGVASTYEPVDGRIATGADVARGTVLGRIGSGSHCAVEWCLHLGARLGEEYLDPLLLLTRVRIVLLPLLPAGGPAAEAS